MSVFSKQYIDIKNFSSVKKVYLNFFNIEIYSMINSSLYSIVFRLVYLSLMFLFLFLTELSTYTSLIAEVVGSNSLNIIYFTELCLFYFIIYSIIILLLSRFVFFNYPEFFENLLFNLNNISLFLYKKLVVIAFKTKKFISALGLPPAEFEKYLNYEKK